MLVSPRYVEGTNMNVPIKEFARVTVMFVVVFTATVFASADEKVRADRTPLTFRDSGLYCNFDFVHGHDPAGEDQLNADSGGVSNMLTPQRAAGPDSPWSFYIVQVYAPEDPDDSLDDALFEQMARHGKKVILRAHIGRASKDVDVDKLERQMVNLFDAIDPDLIYAVTLDEENIYWHGWGTALTELYHRCKKRWPDLPVYQWWTPMQVPNVRAQSGWVALPADGWVIDLYGQRREVFEKKLVQSLETNKPVIHIAWASPTWTDWMGAASWEDGGRQVFDDQVEVCRSYNVPVGYFVCQKYLIVEGKRIHRIRWGWHCIDPVTRDWFAELEALVMNHRLLATDQIGFRALDQAKFDWAHGSISSAAVRFDVDEQGRKRFYWRANPATAAKEAGEHQITDPVAGDYVRAAAIFDESIANTTGAGLDITSIAGRPNRAALTFRIDPTRPIADLKVTVHGMAIRELGGAVEAAASADGESWSAVQQHAGEDREVKLAFDRAGAGFSDEPLWVRVTLIGRAGSPTNVCASLGQLEIAATFEPRLGTAP